METRTIGLDDARGNYLEATKARFLKYGELDPSDCLIIQLRGSAHVALAGLDDQAQRRAIREIVSKNQAAGGDSTPLYLFHAMEVWKASAPPTDPAARAQLEQDWLNKTIDRRPDREEFVIVHEEGLASTIRRWDARVIRGQAGALDLGPWEERSLRLPRPTFKRYFPETAAAPAAAGGN